MTRQGAGMEKRGEERGGEFGRYNLCFADEAQSEQQLVAMCHAGI